MRIDTLPANNLQTQGAARRAWLRQQSPQHLEQSRLFMLSALRQRQPFAAPNALILGAGACTEIPLDELARNSDEVVLVDLDLSAMQRAIDELQSAALRKRVRLLQADISGGVSLNLNRLIKQQPWPTLYDQGAQSVFNAAADCLDRCRIPDPHQLPGLVPGQFGLVISSLVLTQLFSYPLLDMLDHLQRSAPQLLGEQERHHRYQQAAQNFRARIIQAHLALLRGLLDHGGRAAILSDTHGFVFNNHGTDHDSQRRRAIPLVPRTFPAMIKNIFTINQETHWEWLTDLPEQNKPGRGYNVTGYIVSPFSRK